MSAFKSCCCVTLGHPFQITLRFPQPLQRTCVCTEHPCRFCVLLATILVGVAAVPRPGPRRLWRGDDVFGDSAGKSTLSGGREAPSEKICFANSEFILPIVCVRKTHISKQLMVVKSKH